MLIINSAYGTRRLQFTNTSANQQVYNSTTIPIDDNSAFQINHGNTTMNLSLKSIHMTLVLLSISLVAGFYFCYYKPDTETERIFMTLYESDPVLLFSALAPSIVNLIILSFLVYLKCTRKIHQPMNIGETIPLNAFTQSSIAKIAQGMESLAIAAIPGGEIIETLGHTILDAVTTSTMSGGFSDIDPTIVAATAQTVVEQSAASSTVGVTNLNDVSSAQDDRNMTDDSWDLQSQTSRPFLAYSTNWSATNGAGFVIAERSFNDCLKLANTRVYRLLQNFRYMSFDFTIRVSLSSTQFHAGRIKLVCLPSLSTEMVNAPPTPGTYHEKEAFDIENYISLPGLEISAMSAGTHVINVPFSFFRHQFENSGTSGPYEWGRWVLIVLQPLYAPDTASSTIHLNVHMNLNNVRLYMPIPVTVFGQAPTIITPDVQLYKPYLYASNATESVKNATIQSNKNFTVITDRTKLLGYNPMMIDSTYATPTVLSNHHTASTTQPHMAGTASSGELSELFTKEGLLATFPWTTTTNSALARFSVEPMPIFHGTGSNSPLLTQYNVNPLSFNCVPFQFWRGDITYRLLIAKPKFVQGKLSITYSPRGNNTGNTPTRDDEVYNLIVDISETSEVVFTIPYIDSQEYKVIGPTAVDNPSFSVGDITISILNPLTIMDGTTSSVNCLLLVRGQDNFTVANPRNLNYNFLLNTTHNVYQGNKVGLMLANLIEKGLEPGDHQAFLDWLASYNFSKNAVTQASSNMSEISQPNLSNERGFVLGPKVSSAGFTNTMNVDVITNFYDLCKRLERADQRDTSLLSYPVTPSYRYLNFLNHFSKQFRYWNGDLNFGLLYRPLKADLPVDAEACISVSYQSDFFHQGTSEANPRTFIDTGYPCATYRVTQDNMFMVNVPAMSENPLLHTTFQFANSDANGWRPTRAAGSIVINSNRRHNMHLFKGAGENFRLYRWRGTPTTADIEEVVLFQIAVKFFQLNYDLQSLFDDMNNEQVPIRHMVPDTAVNNWFRRTATLVNAPNSVFDHFPPILKDYYQLSKTEEPDENSEPKP